MSTIQKTIGIVFDFDDTLIPDSSSELLRRHHVDPDAFWTESRRLVSEFGYDPGHAYLKLILDNIGKGKPLGNLTNRDLRNFGRKLDDRYHPGVKRLFGDLRREAGKKIDVRFYIISGGLEEIIKGSKTVQDNITWVFGSRLIGDTESSPLKHIKRCVTFTEKTRFLFEINKFGLHLEQTQTNPYLVNEDVDREHRDIPFANMIYIGDGLTDIPCFSLVKQGGGTSFGVFDGTEKSAKRGLREFLKTGRVTSMHLPRYGPNDELGKMLRAAVANRCAELSP